MPDWLPPLVRLFRKWPETAAACGKVVCQDGRLAAAAGLVFADGTLGGLGEAEFDLEARLFNYVRDVDACIGPFIAVRRETFIEMGGFDGQYHTLDFLMTDFCFRARERGLRVCYQPESCIIWLKDYSPLAQASNGDYLPVMLDQRRLVGRWGDRLQAQPARPERTDWATWHALAAPPEGR
jgi:GT2 family glycosyltransferase